MPVLTKPQEPSWESNAYVLATTRIFVLMGTAYLGRSLYKMVSPAWGSRAASTAAGTHFLPCSPFYLASDQPLTTRAYPAATLSGLGLGEIDSNTLALGPGATDAGPDLEANLTIGMQLPQRSYNPHRQAQRSQASPRADDQPAGPPVPPVAADAILEQDVGVRSDGAQIEEGSEISVGLVN